MFSRDLDAHICVCFVGQRKPVYIYPVSSLDSCVCDGPVPVYIDTDRPTDRQTDRQTVRQTDRQTDGRTDRQRDRQAERQTDRQRDRQSD